MAMSEATIVDAFNENTPDELKAYGDADGTIESVNIMMPDDMERALELYDSNPVIHEVLRKDLMELNDHRYGERTIYEYQIPGFLYTRLGTTFGVSSEELGCF